MNVEQTELSYSTDEKSWKKIVWLFLKNVETQDLTDKTAIQFLGIYSREMDIYVHTKTHTQMVIVALLVIAKNCKYLKCPSTGKMHVGICKLEYHSAIKRIKILITIAKVIGLNLLCCVSEVRHKRSHTILFHIHTYNFRKYRCV